MTRTSEIVSRDGSSWLVVVSTAVVFYNRKKNLRSEGPGWVGHDQVPRVPQPNIAHSTYVSPCKRSDDLPLIEWPNGTIGGYYLRRETLSKVEPKFVTSFLHPPQPPPLSHPGPGSVGLPGRNLELPVGNSTFILLGLAKECAHSSPEMVLGSYACFPRELELKKRERERLPRREKRQFMSTSQWHYLEIITPAWQPPITLALFWMTGHLKKTQTTRQSLA
ncbi:hypothetical protein P691DRAFT_784850 [Macrolepiota fuliginosa MF-IS2]|uniref:Uncharacterized protein n=1 Tax=Macrolepiota fuliginosa MF-IS2 TaxID=1400762 RepID=A0A9P6BZR9_9AGAR|nr:hypothetical protein P691DRAFT_784850 [Macrolepiota fuliginosa MF-IS2]